MELIEQLADPVTVLNLVGRLDSTTAPDLSTRLQNLVSSARVCVLLDMTQLNYLSSAGFRALLIGAKLTQQAGGSLVLCGLTAPVRKLFAVTAFDQIFTIHDSRESALRSMSACG